MGTLIQDGASQGLSRLLADSKAAVSVRMDAGKGLMALLRPQTVGALLEGGTVQAAAWAALDAPSLRVKLQAARLLLEICLVCTWPSNCMVSLTMIGLCC